MSQPNECKHSDYKLCFKLKQHTPIIHFQADQKGATLRATELKPKLDRFLIKELKLTEINDKDKKVPKKEYKSWFIGRGKEQLALDYKVRIEPNYNTKEGIPENNALYFASRKPREMSQQEFDLTKKWFKTSDKIFNLTILCLNKELRDKIQNYFASFLVKINFGTRQNKGFGSFYLVKNTLGYKLPDDAFHQSLSTYLYATYKNEKSIDIMKHIEVIYSLMKTGINFPNHPPIKDENGKAIKNARGKSIPNLKIRGENSSYYKSYLFLYMLQQTPKIGNEKRFIKENFFRPNLRLADNGIQKKYVRALLGVGEHVEFKDERRGVIKYNSDEVKRFKSPITFKIIDNQLFIIAEDICKSKIYGKSFKFKHTFGDNEMIKPITIPTRNEFDLNKFLLSFADYFNTLEVTDKNLFDKKISKAKKAKLEKGIK